MEFNIVYDRREQADTFGGSTSRWRAFQTGRTLAELEEVRWQIITYVDENGIFQTNKEAWVDVATHTKRWNGFSFISI